MTAIGITGTQSGMTPYQLATLTLWLPRFRMGTEWLHEGDCIGVDAQVSDMWLGLGGKLHSHPPDNNSKRAFKEAAETEPAKPYLARNRDIVDASDCMVAVPGEPLEQLRSGTWSTIRYARKMGKPILIVRPDGSVVKEGWE